MFKEYIAAIMSVSIVLGGCGSEISNTTQNIKSSQTIPSQILQSYSSIPFGFYEILNVDDKSLLFGTADQTYSMYLLSEDQTLQSVVDTRQVASYAQQSGSNQDCIYLIVDKEPEGKSLSETDSYYELEEMSIENGVNSIHAFYSSEYPRMYGVLSSGDIVLGKTPFDKSDTADISKVTTTGVETHLFSISKEDFLNNTIQVVDNDLFYIDYQRMQISRVSEGGGVEFTINLPRKYVAITEVRIWNDKIYIVAVKKETDTMSWELLTIQPSGELQSFDFEKVDEKEEQIYVTNIDYLFESNKQMWFYAQYADNSELHNYQVILIEITANQVQVYDVQIPYREAQAVITEDICANPDKKAIGLIIGYLDTEQSNKLSVDWLSIELPI